MESSLNGDEEQKDPSTLSNQAIWFFAHTALALGSWLLLMLVGYVVNPPGVSQLVILLLSLCVPLLVGFAFARVRQDEMAKSVWLIGLIWMLIISLWILDMPTGPNACFQCDATEKLTRTFFSLPRPSGLIDNDGPFFGTWPAAALLGYSIGARLALRRKE
jgi:energy-coupling factor transporter transmembrane protein EcfT